MELIVSSANRLECFCAHCEIIIVNEKGVLYMTKKFNTPLL